MKTEAKADVPSDPYLMTGFDKKTMTLSHDGKSDVAFTVEVDFDHRGWHCYQTFRVPAGQTVTQEFPAGFSAHFGDFANIRKGLLTLVLALKKGRCRKK